MTYIWYVCDGRVGISTHPIDWELLAQKEPKKGKNPKAGKK